MQKNRKNDNNSYNRVLLKVSGELLMGNKKFGHDEELIKRIAIDIKEVHEQGLQVCLVVGGGNIHRGTSNEFVSLDRVVSDHIGMLSTVINSLFLMNTLELLGIESRVMSALTMPSVCEFYTKRRAEEHINKRRIVIFSCGTGNPFFTTDTAAVLRALEMDCDIIIKGSSIDGVYSHDPKKHNSAKKILKLRYEEVIEKNLRIMDMTSISLAKDNNLPIAVFSLSERGSIGKFMRNQIEYSLIN